jgi:urea transport system permease protein
VNPFLHFSRLLLWIALVSGIASARASETPKDILLAAILAPSAAERVALIQSLEGNADEEIPPLLHAWRADELFIYKDPSGAQVPVLAIGDPLGDGSREVVRISDGGRIEVSPGKTFVPAGLLTPVEHDNRLRRAMKGVLDLAGLGASDLQERIRSIQTIGFSQNRERLPILEKRLERETHSKARAALEEAIALTQLKDGSDDVKVAALRKLEKLHTLSSVDFVKAVSREASESKYTTVEDAAFRTLQAIDAHRRFVDFFGTLFRGLSLGSVLLIVAIGLAVTFGLMGVINMAHGEMIAVGAYTTYVVHNVFGSGLALSPFGMSVTIPGLNASGFLYESYFLFALPASFLVAALVGIGLERGIIQFLYRRPLESLLATWGVSLVLQQLFRLIFGANNVQVSSPSYLSGNWTVNDILFGWNRVFVICFAALIVLGTYLLLTRTSLGLLIRAVMQNRGMAACMGVRTERVNMLTFGLGSGLAGLAGAFLSQIGNVGPSLGQNYIVDSFMTVVVGGVGSLFGTVISALGIGFVDQSLQQVLGNPVLGKILVLAAIVLFLQWKPAGIFATRSRGLDD